MKVLFTKIIAIVAMITLFVSCDDTAETKSDKKEITKFTIDGAITDGYIATAEGRNYVVVSFTDFDTDVTALVPTIEVSEKATVSPASGVAQDFTAEGGVTYTVTAEDGSTAVYYAVVVKGSSVAEITSFTINGTAATIDEDAKTITLELPADTNLTALTPAIVVSANATVDPASEATQDFTSSATTPIVYTVTAQNGSEETYEVTVTTATATTSDAKVITSFIINGTPATIDEAASPKTITLELPAGTDLKALSPTIVFSDGATVAPLSGAVQSFADSATTPIAYTVTAEDNSTAVYQVTVTAATTAYSDAKAITKFTINGIDATIDEDAKTITLELPAGTVLSALTPTIAISADAQVDPGSEDAQDFTNSVTSPLGYTVTAQNGSEATYTVTVTAATTAYSDAKAITKFTINGIDATIDEDAKTITLELPAGTVLSALTPTIAISADAQVDPGSEDAQDFTNSVTSPLGYTVTAQNGSEATYTVTVTTATAEPTALTSGIFANSDLPDCDSGFANNKEIILFQDGMAYISNMELLVQGACDVTTTADSFSSADIIANNYFVVSFTSTSTLVTIHTSADPEGWGISTDETFDYSSTANTLIAKQTTGSFNITAGDVFIKTGDVTPPVTFDCPTLSPTDGHPDTDYLGNTPSGAQYFILIKKKATWAEAAACAVFNGGSLAEITSQEIQNTIKTAIDSLVTDAAITTSETVAPDGGNASYVWLGGNDLATEGTWIWDGDNKADTANTPFWSGLGGRSGGSAVGAAYTNWGNARVEPDDFNKQQDALGFALTSWPNGAAGEWNDINDTNTLYFIIAFSD